MKVRSNSTLGSEKLLMIFLRVGNRITISVKWKAKKKGWIKVAINANVPYVR